MRRFKRMAKAVLPASMVDWIAARRRSKMKTSVGGAESTPSGQVERSFDGEEVLSRVQALMSEQKFAEALGLVDDVMRSPGAPVFELVSLSVDCCLHLGLARDGVARISRLLDRKVPDVHTEIRFGALRSRISGHLGPLVSALNRIYLANGLVPLLGGRNPESWLEVRGAAPPFEPAEAAVRVSVLVPVVGDAAGLELALSGLASQSWRNLEIIVVAAHEIDAPSDVTVLIEPESNRMVEVGRARASGDVILIHRSDEWSHPQRVEMQVGILEPFGLMEASTISSFRLRSDLTPCPVGSAVGVELAGQNRYSVAHLAANADGEQAWVGQVVPMSIVFAEVPVAEPIGIPR